MRDKLIELVNENVVLTANAFNLSIFNQFWLISNGIIDQDDLKEGYTFTPVFNQIKTKDFQLTVVPDRLQLDMVPKNKIKGIDLVRSKLEKIIEKLPHTPYTALGINYSYFFTPESANFQEFTRSLFVNPKSPLAFKFDSHDARFGAYFALDILGLRVQLSALPVKVPDKDNIDTEKIKFDFNFHLDLTDDNKSRIILEYLERRDEFRRFTENILDCIR